MISVREAQEIILQSVPVYPQKLAALTEALGRYLAKSIESPLDLPSFNNSAMDGYAIKSEETLQACPDHPLSLKVSFTVKAGDQPKQELRQGEAARIFTGAMIPPGTDAVVIQENVVRKDDEITLQKPLKPGQNIRKKGEEIKVGEQALENGTLLNPASVGFLASMGLKTIPIHTPPRVGILVTGSEIVRREADFGPGKVYDSNFFSLSTALEELNLYPSFQSHGYDRLEDLKQEVSEGFSQSDFLLVTGGVSVGDFDFVKEVAAKEGVKEVFWRVKQKPGKPIFFGKKGDSGFLFGLPGNPASALVCFYEYVRPALLKAMGAKQALLPRIRVPIAKSLKKKSGKVHFYKGVLKIQGGEIFAELLDGQGSHLMKSFSQANCLIRIPEGTEVVGSGEMVEVDLLPSVLRTGGD